MDYLEGALLGKRWSDTDFENQKHRGMTLFLCALFWIYALFLVFRANFMDVKTSLGSVVLWLFISAILLIASPFVSYYYYSVPLPLRFIFLLVQGLKYLASYFFLFALLLPLTYFDKEKLLTQGLAYLNERVGMIFEQVSVDQGLAPLFFNAILLAIVTMGLVALIFVVLAVLPVLYTKLINVLQIIIDQTFIGFMRGVKSGSKTVAKARTSKR